MSTVWRSSQCSVSTAGCRRWWRATLLLVPAPPGGEAPTARSQAGQAALGLALARHGQDPGPRTEDRDCFGAQITLRCRFMRVEATAPRQRGLHASGIDKAFGTHQVLNGANLSVEAGEVVGLLGANGAGKTTFISIATGALAADGGRVHLDGIDVATDRRAAARRLGTAPQELGVYPMLTVRENVIGMARVHGLSSRRARASSEEAIEALGLTACAGTRAEHLSGGQRRRLHTAMALAHQPAVVFLDEPTVGADIESRHQIVRHVRSLADAGAAVVYTTHYVHELEHLGARLAVLAGGRIQDHGPVQDAIDA